MLTIDMLPAGRGDALWVEYGEGGDLRKILVDGGVSGTAIRDRITAMAPAICRFELLIITHIDLDHIGGVLDLLRDPPLNLEVGGVWFNGWRHLVASELLSGGKQSRLEARDKDLGVLGAKQGERLSFEIERRGYLWNEAFGGGPIVIGENGPLPRHSLEGGLKITLLGPSRKRLQGLRKAWESELLKAHWRPGEALEQLGEEKVEQDEGLLGPAPDLQAIARTVLREDTSKANGSSIALILQHEESRCLLTGDAYARDLTDSVMKLSIEEGESVLAVQALKLSHHGGKRNTSTELIRSLSCPRFLISTNGGQHQHPDAESLARVIVHGESSSLRPTLFFNYRTDVTERWGDNRLLHKYKFEVQYPPDGTEGLKVEL